MLRKLALLGLLIVAGLAAYFIRIPLEWGMSPEEISRAVTGGRGTFATQCVACHAEQPNAPGPAELRSDFSQSELSGALSTPPPGMPPFAGTDEEKRNLILYLTRG
jgi:mono/diheme cytochrome c family protein